jgi:hypothetical protein
MDLPAITATQRTNATTMFDDEQCPDDFSWWSDTENYTNHTTFMPESEPSYLGIEFLDFSDAAQTPELVPYEMMPATEPGLHSQSRIDPTMDIILVIADHHEPNSKSGQDKHAAALVADRLSLNSQSRPVARLRERRLVHVQNLDPTYVSDLARTTLFCCVEQCVSRFIGRHRLIKEARVHTRGKKREGSGFSKSISAVIEITGRRGWKYLMCDVLLSASQLAVGIPVVLYEPWRRPQGASSSGKHSPIAIIDIGLDPVAKYRRILREVILSVSATFLFPFVLPLMKTRPLLPPSQTSSSIPPLRSSFARASS